MTEENPIEITLFALEKRRPARICGFSAAEDCDQTRLREIGFAEGDLVEILHVGLFGRSPLNVKLHGTAIAMRPNEAKMIRVIPADLHRDMGQGDMDNQAIAGNVEVCDVHGLPTSVEKPCCGACGSASSGSAENGSAS